MNIRYLEILEAIEQTGTFTGAAKKLHLTQSAVSHAVAELEGEAGTPLFDRLPRGVRLTNCGISLLEEARGILAACRSLDKRMGHLEECTPIHVVSSITIASFMLPRIINHVKARIPEVQIHVRVMSAANALTVLREGEADVAFLEGTIPKGQFRVIQLGAYRLCAAGALSFPLPEHTLSAKDLCACPLLLREPGSAIRDTFDSMLALENQKAYPVWESVNSSALIRAAEAGLGITVLPDMLLEEAVRQKRLHMAELDGVMMENKMLAVLHKDKYITHALQVLLDTLAEMENPDI